MQQPKLKQFRLNRRSLRRFIWRSIQWLSLLLLSLGLTLGLLFGAGSNLDRAWGVTPVARLMAEGQAFYTNQQFQAAIDRWQQIERLAQSDPWLRGMTFTYLSLAYQQLGNWQAAETAIETSLTLLEADPSINSNSTVPDSTRSLLRASLVAQALNAKGRLAFALGQFEAALTTWQQATIQYQQAQDPIGRVGSLINQAQAMEASGLYRHACQTLLSAIDMQQDCNFSKIVDRQPDRQQMLTAIRHQFNQQSDPALQRLGLRNLGNLLRLLGDLPQAHQLLTQSVALAQAADSIPEQSMALLQLAEVETAQYSQAKDLFDRTQLDTDRDRTITQAHQALQRYQTVISQTQNLPIAQIVHWQAQLKHLSLLIDLQKWLNRMQSSRVIETETALLSVQIPQQIAVLMPNSLFSQLPISRTTIYMQLSLAQSLMTQDTVSAQQIEALIQQAIAQARTLADPQAESYGLGNLGQWYLQRADLGGAAVQSVALQQAEQVTQQALGLAQAHHAWDIAYQWQWQLGRIHTRQGQQQAAIADYEAAVETLKTVRNDLRAIAAEVQFSFRDQVEPVYRELVALRLQLIQSQRQSKPREQLRQIIREVDALQLTELENFLRCDLTNRVEVSQVVVDPTAAIIYPIILEQQLAVVLSLPQSEQILLHAVPIDQTTVNQTLDQLRQELEQPYVSPTGLSLSQQVYDWLIRPLSPTLAAQSIKTLVFVLDGSFRNIPMAALHDRHHYLIQDYAVALTPGLDLLQPQPLQSPDLRVLSFGLSQIRQNFPAHQDFAPLTNVEIELQEIRSQVPTQTLLNQQFTRSSLETQVRHQPAAIVHLATHGQFSSNPDETFILAWDQRISIDSLSRILQERQDPNAPIELLVLSACKTAEGDNRATLGIAGIAVQSGARSTIASLWNVDDQATADLMADFYRDLVQTKTPISKAEALRRAQVRLLQKRGYHAPLYWSPYLLVGNWL